MKRMKTFAMYALWIILFWILSDILIHVGINTTYRDIERRGEMPQGIEVVQMQATAVNDNINITVNSNILLKSNDRFINSTP